MKSVSRTKSSSSGSDDAAKEARKRAKEKARSMHARVFRNKEEDAAPVDHNKIRSNSTSHGRRMTRQGSLRRMNRQSSMPRLLRRSASARRMGMNKQGSMRNVSIDSISELEAVIVFDDSTSSISQLTGSFSSLQSSFANSCVTQGPAVFDPKAAEKRSSVAPRMPNRASSRRQLDCAALSDSNSSLTLEDIKEDNQEDVTSTTAGAMTETAREWSETRASRLATKKMPESIPEMNVVMSEHGREWIEKSPSKTLAIKRPVRVGSMAEIGVNMKAGGREWNEGSACRTTAASIPVRVGSVADITIDINSGSESSLSMSQSGSTVTGVSFFSASSSMADTFAVPKQEARCAS